MYIKGDRNININLFKLEDKSHSKILTKILYDPTRKFRKFDALVKRNSISTAREELFLPEIKFPSMKNNT